MEYLDHAIGRILYCSKKISFFALFPFCSELFSPGKGVGRVERLDIRWCNTHADRENCTAVATVTPSTVGRSYRWVRFLRAVFFRRCCCYFAKATIVLDQQLLERLERPYAIPSSSMMVRSSGRPLRHSSVMVWWTAKMSCQSHK